MLSLLKKLFMFRVGQKTTRGVAHSVGLHSRLASIAGLIGGFRYMRKHSS